MFLRPTTSTLFDSLNWYKNACSLRFPEIGHEGLKRGFEERAEDFEKLYYLNAPDSLRVCVLQAHMLLHDVDYIDAAGPVWVTWQLCVTILCKSRNFRRLQLVNGFHSTMSPM